MRDRILVATDGSGNAQGALRVAHILAERRGYAAEAITVVEPFPAYEPICDGMVEVAWPELQRARVAAKRGEVRGQLIALGTGGWPLALEIGPVAPMIADHASRRGAALIVMGLGRHALADRLFGSETAVRVMRLASVPVLAVPNDAATLPRTALIATDFSSFSFEAARSALRVVAPGATLHVAHVFWRPPAETSWVGGRDWIWDYRDRVGRELARFAAELSRDAGDEVQVVRHVLDGNPARELLRLAERVEADLIAAGSHGTGFVGRMIMGSVSARLVRGARCSVLVSPPPQAFAAAETARQSAGRLPVRVEEPVLALVGPV